METKTTKQKAIAMRAEGHRVEAEWADARGAVNAAEAAMGRELASFAVSGDDYDLMLCRARFDELAETRVKECAALVAYDRYQFTIRLATIQADHAQEDE